GMGEVYLAARADGLFERTVALKRVRADLAPSVAARFSTERQILADLVHPGIARLYAAGMDDVGRPWLAMEPVEGRPLPAYAREHDLTTRQRVELVMQVCAALQHAHQRLVIHRDLKPSNVLVVDAPDGPRAQLLDFGIAKILGDEVDTRRFLTRAYAAPEQLRGEAATTASDLYGLGALLLETLSGKRPSEPGIAPGLDGDLEAIARKALALEPSDRYASAEALADDLRRFLEGRPVDAQTPSLGYRIGRFVSRHRIPVSIAALAFLIASVTAIAAALRVSEERDIARQAAADAEAVAEAQGQILRVLEPTFRAELDTSSTNPASPTVTEVVEEAIETVEEAYEDSPAVLAQSLVTLGTTLLERGEVTRADSLFARAIALRRPLGREGDKVIRDALIGRGLANRRLSNPEVARGFFRQALEMERNHPQMVPDGSSTEVYLAGVLDDSQAREATLLRTLSERQAALAEIASPTSEDEIPVAQAHNELGVHYFNSGFYREAFAEYRAAEVIVRRHFGELHTATNAMRANLSYASAEMGRYREAERHARIALGAATRGGLGPGRIASMHQAIGQALFFQDELADSERELTVALEMYERERGPDAPETHGVLNSLLVVLAAQGRHDEALAVAERVEALHRAEGTLQESGGLYARSIVAALRYARGQRAASLEQLEGLVRPASGVEMIPGHRAVILGQAGDALRESGDPAAAVPLLREALELVRQAKPDEHWNVRHARLAYGRALAEMGRAAEARPHLEAARGHVRRVSFPSVLEDVDAEIDRLLSSSR
ncbi:MAG: serine/threonine-protein kinase, partial [Bacteroidota bacterium]